MLYALIFAGAVENIIIADPNFIKTLPEGIDSAIDLTDIQEQPRIGYLYDGVNFTPAPPVIPPDSAPTLQTVQTELQQDQSQIAAISTNIATLQTDITAIESAPAQSQPAPLAQQDQPNS